MRKVLLSFLAFAFVIAIAIPKTFQGQTPSPALHLPGGTATDISSAEVQALVQKTAADRVSDQAIRVVNVNGQYNVSIGVVHRAKTSGKDAPSGIEHAQITEVYHVIEGNGTLVTGGTLDNPREIQAESPVVTVLNGPSTGGSGIQGGVSRKIGPGDVVIIPPNTPHRVTEITTAPNAYLAARVEPP